MTLSTQPISSKGSPISFDIETKLSEMESKLMEISRILETVPTTEKEQLKWQESEREYDQIVIELPKVQDLVDGEDTFQLLKLVNVVTLASKIQRSKGTLPDLIAEMQEIKTELVNGKEIEESLSRLDEIVPYLTLHIQIIVDSNPNRRHLLLATNASILLEDLLAIRNSILGNTEEEELREEISSSPTLNALNLELSPYRTDLPAHETSKSPAPISDLEQRSAITLPASPTSSKASPDAVSPRSLSAVQPQKSSASLSPALLFTILMLLMVGIKALNLS